MIAAYAPERFRKQPTDWPFKQIRGFTLEPSGLSLGTSLYRRLRAPRDCEGLAEMLKREAPALLRPGAIDANSAVLLFDRCDAWRRPERLPELITALQCEHPEWTSGPRWLALLAAARTVDTAAVAQAATAHGASGPAIGRAITRARFHAMAALPP